ncbi:MAG TPA: type VII secretion integral membrane protein EccD [Mycobacterium sp.]|nr:type VII secretion integral membrane protein EccD [Mycobacterium sp.]
MTETLGTPVLPVVRVAILAGNRMTEVALPAELPLREILPAVHRLVRSGGSRDSEDPAADELPAAPRPLSLAPIGGAPFSLDARLDTVGVVDGDLLALQEIPVGPAAPGIVEDIADAAVIFSESRKHPWGPGHVRKFAAAAAVSAIVVATGLAVAHRLRIDSPVGVYGASAIALLTVIAALGLRSRDRATALGLSVAAVVPIAAAFALAVPAPFGAAQLVLATAGVTAWALISMILGKDGLQFFTATTVVGTGLFFAAGAASLWKLPMTTLGCLLLLVALLVTIQAAQLSALWARFPLPVIPAPGDPAPTAPAMRVLTDLPHRVRIGEAHQTGFIAGSVVLSVLGSLAVLGRPDTSPWAWYLVAATALAAMLRARVWDTVTCKAWLLAQPLLVITALPALFAAQGRQPAAVGTVVALVVLVAGWIIVAAGPRLADADSYSLPMRRLLGFFAGAVDVSLIPVMAYLVGLFAWVLDR